MCCTEQCLLKQNWEMREWNLLELEQMKCNMRLPSWRAPSKGEARNVIFFMRSQEEIAKKRGDESVLFSGSASNSGNIWESRITWTALNSSFEIVCLRLKHLCSEAYLWWEKLILTQQSASGTEW